MHLQIWKGHVKAKIGVLPETTIQTILERFSKYIAQAKVTSVYFKLHQEHEFECLLWIEDY